ncbi:MAG: hypothetical protein OXC11_09830 [Rhodospirillales bacterium]|nr:hypothetical protein [Rhodospirillales bacterium]
MDAIGADGSGVVQGDGGQHRPDVKCSGKTPVLFNGFLGKCWMESDSVKNKSMSGVKAREKRAVQLSKFLNNVLIVEVSGIPVQETAGLSVAWGQMLNDRGIYK